jgi:protein-tyrosine-phosphatase
MPKSLKILTVCTGNVSRSVMLGFMLTSLAEAHGMDWKIRTAGTFALEGSSMSSRTRNALLSIDELGERQYGGHRSHQLDGDDVAWADIILASEADHVMYVHRHFPSGATKAVQIVQFVRDAPLDETLARQLDVVTLLGPSPEFDVADPAGGDELVYNECASLLWELSQAFTTLVSETEFR